MKMRKSQVFVLVGLLVLLACALVVTASASSSFIPNPTDSTILVRYEGDDADVTIPNTFRTIGAQAFIGNTNIVTVTIPDSITSMGADAFSGCTSLQEVYFTGTPKLELVPARAFKNAASLREIMIPKSVTTIGTEAFYGCVNLIDVMGPDPAIQGSFTFYPVSAYVTSIGTNAFGNCPKAVVQCFKGSAMETYLNDNPSIQKTVVDPIIYSIKATRKPFAIIWDPTNSAQVQLTVTVDPSFVSTDILGYSTGDQSIMKISETGLMTPVKPGTCMATVYEQKNLSVYDEVPIVVLDDRATWQQWNGDWFYCKSRTEFAIGWQKIGGVWYHFKDSGVMDTGWLYDGGSWYYLHPSGAMATGWLNLPAGSNTWYYFNAGGALVTGWLKLNNQWFYFETATGATYGQMYYGGTYNINGTNYMFDNNGHLLTNSGWQQAGSTWYYYSGNGLYKGWLYWGKNWYFLSTDTGAMVTGWLNDGGKWYYLYGSGAMATGWVKIGNDWFYFNASGAMVTGWLKDGAYWYYLRPEDGAMVTGTYTIDGVTYGFAASGVWIW